DASRIWGSIVTFFSSTWQTIRSNAALGWSNVKLGITSAWNDLKADASRIWGSVKGIFSNTWTNIKNTAVNAWNGLKISAANIWGGIKNTISNQISNIKKLFNFKWSLPKIKLPHFSVSWSTAGFWGKVGDFLGLPGKPNIGVNWYAKGGIFNQPSVIGVGEAGREAVLPLDSNTGWADTVADRLASAMQGVQLAGAGAGGGDIYVYIGNEQVDAYVYRSQDRRNIRSNGR
ncbi:MAG TPA: hypothetical protein VFC74_00970, partial [Oscillospiraceae bacterium]|nr:hypothetical protein [Oscillospiraceae bacterium]